MGLRLPMLTSGARVAPAEPRARRTPGERGINMVDLMAWLVIAALLLAAALQGIGYYQQTALTYQAKSDLSGEQTWAAGRVSLTSTVPTAADLQTALNDGDLKLSATGGTPNAGFISSSGGSSYCMGVQVPGIAVNNVFYSSSDSPSNIQRVSSLTDPVLTANCGAATAVASPSPSTSSATPTATASPSPTATATTAPHLFTSLALAQQSGAPANAAAIASSADGSTLVASDDVVVGSSSSNYLMRSTDYGKTWNQLAAAGSRSWYGVASSADGKTILAVDNANGLVWLSKDGGATWASDPGTVTGSSDSGVTPASKLGNQYWGAAAVSRNGTTLVVASGHNGSGHLWWSEDGGSTWTQHGSADFRSVSVSDDGNTIAAADVSYGLWDMTISGTKGASANWAQQGNNVSSKYTSVSVSGDGLTVLAGMADQYGCLVVGTRSTNSMTTGFTYTMLGMGYHSPRTTSPGVPSDTYHVSISADGTKALAVGQNGHALTSTNLTDHPATTDPTWPSYPTVTDGGFSLATFTAQSSPAGGQWWSTAISGDGSHLAFGSQNNVPLVTGAWN